jgi:hypothetical protein
MQLLLTLPPVRLTRDKHPSREFVAAFEHDFCRLADILETIQGQFMMSLNDHPEVRRIFAGFRLEEVTTTYSTGRRPPSACRS